MSAGLKAARPRQETVDLQVPVESGLIVSEEVFARLCRQNPDLRLERTARGELIAMAPAGTESGARNALLTYRLGRWSEGDGSGRFFDSSAGFTLPLGGTRAPDASWIRNDRWDALSADQKKGFAPICPDFAVELCSPSDELPIVRDKMQEYLANGLRLGWLIDPRTRTVEIFRPGRPVETLTDPTSLSGEDVLRGFVLDLKRILFD